MEITCFKAYDVRGRIPDELNPHVAYRIANATVEYLDAKRVVVCRDIRLTSDELATAVQKGIVGAGAEAIDIGVGGTEQVYFATAHLGADAGIMALRLSARTPNQLARTPAWRRSRSSPSPTNAS